MSGHEIIEGETRWAHATRTHQADRLNALMHPNFVFVGLRSAGLETWSRSQWMTATQRIAFRALEYKVRDLQVFGSTAVATIDGRWTAEAGGESYDELFTMTDVWVKAPGSAWRVVRRHSTRYVEDPISGKTMEGKELALDI